MKRGSQFAPAVSCLMALWETGCGEGHGNTQRADPSEEMPQHEPMATGCQAWREASCEFVARCDQPSAADCTAQYSAISCKSDQLAEDCANRVAGANCGEVAAECRPGAIAETAHAIQSCRAYVEASCASAVKCRFAATSEQCMASASTDCDAAVGLRPSYEQCLMELPNVACSAWIPPASCAGVVIVR